MPLDAPSSALKSKLKTRKQVTALPVIYDEAGCLRVMLITSRKTKRLIIPKGWSMKGRRDCRAAATEARQEMGLLGRAHQKPLGSYASWKRLADHFVYCRVKVFVLEVTAQLTDWREKGQRVGMWLLVDDAAELVDDPGLVTIIRDLPARLTRRQKRGVQSARKKSDRKPKAADRKTEQSNSGSSAVTDP